MLHPWLNENLVVEFGTMEVVVDGDGQQVVGALGGGGGAALSVFADEVAIGHELGCLGKYEKKGWDVHEEDG